MLSKYIPLAIFLLLASAQSWASSDEYPGRELFPDVDVISTEKLVDQFDDVVIVDVRSSFEYKTVHINGAIHVPLAGSSFAQDIKALRERAPAKTLVMYCNGKSCFKSYKAVRKAQSHGVHNILSYDSGVFDFAKAHPDETTLLGETPILSEDIISEYEFSDKLVEPDVFVDLAAEPQVTILDIREPSQREGISLFIGQEKRASLDDQEALTKVLDEVIESGDALLVYDQSGKQVRWLMYQLEKIGLSQYMFLKGGASAYFNQIQESFLSKR